VLGVVLLAVLAAVTVAGLGLFGGDDNRSSAAGPSAAGTVSTAASGTTSFANGPTGQAPPDDPTGDNQAGSEQAEGTTEGPGAGSAAFGAPVPVVSAGRQTAVLTVGAPVPATDLAGTAPRAGSFLAFRIELTAAEPETVHNPLYFAVVGPDGQRYPVIVAGGQQPQLDVGTLAAGDSVVAFVTVDAPPNGSLVFAPSPDAPVTTWTY
jgi:hypothetical protein